MNGALLQAIHDGGLVFDGAMGSMLIARGLDSGRAPETWNRDRPDDVRSIHAEYLDAGARVVTTNTFGGTMPRLSTLGLGNDALALNADGLRLARAAVDTVRTDAFVALSIGPTGLSQAPVGNATPDDVSRAFERQMRAAAGAGAPDLVLVETMYDAREAELALRCARTVFPETAVVVTFAFNKNPRGFFTIMGDDARDATQRMRTLGAVMTGANCALPSGDMLGLARVLRAATDAPLLCQPNAGAPRVVDGAVLYDQHATDFARDADAMLASGINAVGGCCGTTPEFIATISKGGRG